MMKMMVSQRRGIPYVKELLDLAPLPMPLADHRVKAAVKSLGQEAKPNWRIWRHHQPIQIQSLTAL